MTRLLSAGASLVPMIVPAVLAALLVASGTTGAQADDPNSGGDITVTVVDPSASPSPAASAAGSGSTGGSTGSGGGSSSGAGGSDAGSGEGSGGGSSGSGIPQWLVLSGLDNAAHSEIDPFRGYVRSTVSVANRSTSETVNGELTFRLRSFLGGQLGPTVTREITGLRPGKTSTTTADLVGLGQWPLVQLSVTFEQRGTAHPGPLTREAWVVGFPWLLLVFLILAVAALAVVRIRRVATVRMPHPEPAT